jgi:hypothetical protein
VSQKDRKSLNICLEFDQILDLGALPDSKGGEGPQQPIKAFEQNSATTAGKYSITALIRVAV